MSFINNRFSKDWLFELENTFTETLDLFSQLTELEGNFKYRKNKWTLKELLEHLTDCEKIFNYRALRFSKNDQTELSGFDENLYVSNGNAKNQPLELLIEEFKLIRLSSIYFFGKLSEEELARVGISNGNLISVSSIAKHIATHNQHHLNIIKERYLPHLVQNNKLFHTKK